MFDRSEHIRRKISRGDIQSFERLFHEQYASMCSFAFSLVKTESEAEEIVQEVFYRIWKNRGSIVVTGSWKSYLMKAVYNESLMLLRRKKFTAGTEKETESSDSVSPQEVLQESELALIVEETLNGLPSKTRQIFQMNRYEGLKYYEIAGKLAISVKTVEANMSRALHAFRIALKDYRG